MSSTTTTPARAIVASAPDYPNNYKPGNNWKLQSIAVPNELKDGDLLIEMTATGICHTDLLTTSYPDGTPGIPYPRVVGHEGSGYVKAIGPGVKKDVKVGDPVLLSFDHCGQCESCRGGHPAYCSTFIPLNIPCVPDVFQPTGEGDGKGIAGKSFGQSSFASLSVVKETCILPAKDLIKSKEELQLFAPLGCGIQTGAGAVLRLAKPGKDDRVLVMGLGGVGLSAVMAAKISGCVQIVAVDRVQSRIELAKTLGATHGLDTTGVEDVTKAFKDATGGLGPTLVIDSTGVVALIKAGADSLAPRGALVFIGASADPNFKMDINITQHMMNGSRILGCCEGDSLPHEFIPELIKYYREGTLQLDKISKFYKVDEYEKALHDMHSGETIKPILLF